MKFTPKPEVEGINSSREHPLKDFSILLIALVLILGLVALFAGRIAGELSVLFGDRVEKFAVEKGFATFYKSETSSTNLRLNKILERLVSPDLKNPIPRISIICEKDANAFALPGRLILVTNELLSKVKTEQGLAFVLAHELGHIANKDHLRGFGRAVGLSMVLGFMGFSEVGEAAITNTIVSMSSLTLTREQEKEADEFAMMAMMKAYGSLHGASEFFDSLMLDKKWTEIVPAIFKSHPATDERVRALKQKPLNDKDILRNHEILHKCD